MSLELWLTLVYIGMGIIIWLFVIMSEAVTNEWEVVGSLIACVLIWPLLILVITLGKGVMAIKKHRRTSKHGTP